MSRTGIQLLVGALLCYVIGVVLVAIGPSINNGLGTVSMALGGVLKSPVAVILAVLGLVIIGIDLIRGAFR